MQQPAELLSPWLAYSGIIGCLYAIIPLSPGQGHPTLQLQQLKVHVMGVLHLQQEKIRGTSMGRQNRA